MDKIMVRSWLEVMVRYMVRIMVRSWLGHG